MQVQSIAQHGGRIILAGFFILAGLNKILSPAGTQAMIEAAGLAPVGAVYLATIALELGAGLALALGGRWSVPAGFGLAVFCIATNIVFHQFWAADGAEAQVKLSLFFKNVAIAGALCYVAGAEWTRGQSRPDERHA